MKIFISILIYIKRADWRRMTGRMGSLFALPTSALIGECRLNPVPHGIAVMDMTQSCLLTTTA
jgi:hypothetical protein